MVHRYATGGGCLYRRLIKSLWHILRTRRAVADTRRMKKHCPLRRIAPNFLRGTGKCAQPRQPTVIVWQLQSILLRVCCQRAFFIWRFSRAIVCIQRCRIIFRGRRQKLLDNFIFIPIPVGREGVHIVGDGIHYLHIGRFDYFIKEICPICFQSKHPISKPFQIENFSLRLILLLSLFIRHTVGKYSIVVIQSIYDIPDNHRVDTSTVDIVVFAPHFKFLFRVQSMRPYTAANFIQWIKPTGKSNQVLVIHYLNRF